MKYIFIGDSEFIGGICSQPDDSPGKLLKSSHHSPVRVKRFPHVNDLLIG